MASNETDLILEKLARDVESAVHALYRGEVRQATAKARTDQLVHEARTALAALRSAGGRGPTPATTPAVPARPAPRISSPRPAVSAPMHAGAAFGWTTEDSDAVLKCIMSWLPVGGPASTASDSKCIAPGRMLIPTWGERERAREAVRLITDG